MAANDANIDYIHFDGVAPNAIVRYAVINGKKYLSIRDIIVHMCKKDNNQAGGIWRRLPDEYKDELEPFCRSFQFPGRGQSRKQVITLPGAIKLAMFLPGEHAKEHRYAMATILNGYLDEGESLEEDEAFHFPRDDLKLEQVCLGNEEIEESKKRKREMEDVELQGKKLANVETFVNLMNTLEPNWTRDNELNNDIRGLLVGIIKKDD